MALPFFVLHYGGNADRRDYLRKHFAPTRIKPVFIRSFDREDPRVAAAARFDHLEFRSQVTPIKDILVGYAIGLLQQKNESFARCVVAYRGLGTTLDQDFERWEWLKPRALTLAEASVSLKHREAWRRLAASDEPHGIIAEDDIIFAPQSEAYLGSVLGTLPADFDYIDIAGGCGLTPRVGNGCVNGAFFLIDPPRDRTACCAIISRRFAARMLAAAPRIALPPDWTLTWLFNALGAKVYWLEPTVFGHGSELGAYSSTLGRAGLSSAPHIG